MVEPHAVGEQAVVHRAYCVDPRCAGCVPSDEQLAEWPILPLWGEMVERCVPQSPATKTRDGALAALIEDGPTYRELVARLRAEKLEAAENARSARAPEGAGQGDG